MIDETKTKVIRMKNQNTTHVFVICDNCGEGRWSQPGNAKRLSEGHLCRKCSNIKNANRKHKKGMKVCVRCGIEKSIDNFGRRKDRVNSYKSKCHKCNAELMVERRNKNIERSRTMKRGYQRTRRAAKAKSGGTFTEQEWIELKEKYGNVCLCCGSTGDLQPDHVIPISKGGRNDINNIQPLCGLCNRKKQATYKDYRC